MSVSHRSGLEALHRWIQLWSGSGSIGELLTAARVSAQANRMEPGLVHIMLRNPSVGGPEFLKTPAKLRLFCVTFIKITRNIRGLWIPHLWVKVGG